MEINAKANFFLRIISRTISCKNELKLTKTFAFLSHFSFHFKKGFSVSMSGQKGWGFFQWEAEKHSELQSVEIDRV